jgi:hypothetical protein
MIVVHMLPIGLGLRLNTVRHASLVMLSGGDSTIASLILLQMKRMNKSVRLWRLTNEH